MYIKELEDAKDQLAKLNLDKKKAELEMQKHSTKVKKLERLIFNVDAEIEGTDNESSLYILNKRKQDLEVEYYEESEFVAADEVKIAEIELAMRKPERIIVKLETEINIEKVKAETKKKLTTETEKE